MGKVFCALLLATTAFFGSTALAVTELEQANQLISQSKYIEAFDLLAPLEFDLSGDEDFDLLFGFTALEAGHISLATLALERVLALNPDNLTARFHLARAYFVLDDFDGARREFEILLSMNPNVGVRETVGQYLDAIVARDPSSTQFLTGYVALGIGLDTNVTDGPPDNPIFFPGVNRNIALADDDLEDEDSYRNLSAGFDLVHQFSDTDSVYTGGDLNHRGYTDREDRDYLLANLRGGYQHSFGNQAVRAGLNLGYVRLDDEPYRHSDAYEIEWRGSPAPKSQIAAVLVQARFRHRDSANEVSDYDDSRLNLSYLRVLGEHSDKLISSALDIGRERDLNGRADGDLNYVELSLTGQIQFSSSRSGFLQLSYRVDDYQSENALFAEKRNDLQTNLVGGLVFKYGDSYSLRAVAIISTTNSNFSIYDTSREDVSITLRKDFL